VGGTRLGAGGRDRRCPHHKRARRAKEALHVTTGTPHGHRRQARPGTETSSSAAIRVQRPHGGEPERTICMLSTCALRAAVQAKYSALMPFGCQRGLADAEPDDRRRAAVEWRESGGVLPRARLYRRDVSLSLPVPVPLAVIVV
jgi:hypothetical protein